LSRPVVGITAAIDRARWAVWHVEANVSQRTYSRAIAAAGGLPVVLPAHDEIAADPAGISEALDLLDGLILSGGSDLDPSSYGAEPDERTTAVFPERDRFELALARAAVEDGLPLLAICRGMQILNVALGGDLEQHLPSAERHMHSPGVFSDHDVELEAGSLAERAAGCAVLSVRSHHHQGLGRLGEGLAVSGHSVGDGVVEAVEMPDHPFGLGILWHPEEEERSAIVAALVEAARGDRSASANVGEAGA
jgi:putative glutamine amidotransferase